MSVRHMDSSFAFLSAGLLKPGSSKRWVDVAKKIAKANRQPAEMTKNGRQEEET